MCLLLLACLSRYSLDGAVDQRARSARGMFAQSLLAALSTTDPAPSAACAGAAISDPGLPVVIACSEFFRPCCELVDADESSEGLT